MSAATVARASGWVLLASLWSGGCGGEQAPTPGPQASTLGGTAAAEGAPAPQSAESAAQKRFGELSKEIDKLGKGEAFDRGRLESELKEIAKLDPDFAPARFDLAVLREHDGDKEGARREYEALSRAFPDFAPAQENLAAFLVVDGKGAEAMQIYKRIIARQPKDVTARLALARLLSAQGQYREAITLSRQALQHQADAIEAFRILAESYEAQGDVNMAELIIGRGLKVNKNDVELHYLTAKILLDKGDLAGGVTKLKEVVTLDPKWFKVRAQLAEIALKYRDYGNAAQQYEAILKDDPKNHAARIGLAVAYKGMGRFEQAEKVYQDLLAENANDAPALWNVAVLYHHNLNRYDDAIAMYKRYKAAASGKDEKVGDVDKLVAELEKLKTDIAAAKAREEREKKKLEAIQSACAATREGKRPNAEAIGNDQERVEVAWQLMVDGQQAAQGGNIAAAEASVKCAYAIIPDTPGARAEACAPMRNMWTPILYQLGRVDDAVANNKQALKCDPSNPEAQLMDQQLKEVLEQQKAKEGAGAAEKPTAPAAPAKAPARQGGKKRRGR
jgi:tetratricopeptide (TPR) repeat protein